MENLNKTAINNGLIIAAISIFIQLISYYVMPSMLASLWFGATVGIISIVIYVMFTLDLRKKVGGYWTFREALKGIFLMALVAGIVAQIFNLAYYKFVEPGAFDKISGFMNESLRSNFEKMNMDEVMIDEQLIKAEENLKAQYNPTVVQFFKTLGIAILIEFVMSLIFAAIFKKERPAFEQVTQEENDLGASS